MTNSFINTTEKRVLMKEYFSMTDLIKDIIYSSIRNLFQNQLEIFDNTSETNYTEWNLSYHLSNEMSKYIFWLNIDLDVTKRNYQNKRPDIIFHRRKINTLNFLVVELKKSRSDNQSDVEKIKEDWMSEPLNYRYGVYINIWGVEKFKATLFENDGEESVIDERCNYIPIIDITNLENKNLFNEVESYTNRNGVNQNIDFLDRHILNIYTRK